jgi:hypothetical protein
MPAAIGGAGAMPSQNSAPYVDVLSFGTVKGDGVTDDSAAIQAVINANPTRTIYIPGTANGYRLGSTLTLSGFGQILQGDGKGFTSKPIAGQATGTVLVFDPGVTGIALTQQHQGLRDLALVGSEPWNNGYSQSVLPARWYSDGPLGGVARSAGASDADGVRMLGAYCWMRNVSCSGFGRDGVNANNNDLFGQYPLGIGPDDALVDGCYFGYNRGDGLNVAGPDSNVVETRATTVVNNHVWGIFTAPQECGYFSSPQATQNHSDVAQYKLGYSWKAAVGSLKRTGGTVTLTWATPFWSSANLAAGDGIYISRCDPDPSFVGRWRIASVTNDGSGNNVSLTFAQNLPDTGTVTGTGSGASATIVGIAARLANDGTVTGARRDATPAPVTVTGNVTKGSAVVTNLSSTAGIQAGALSGWTSVGGAAMWCNNDSASYFPPDTRVVSVDSATQVTLSKPATASGTGASLKFGFPWSGPVASVTFAAPYLSTEVNMPVVPFRVGQGITLLNCSDKTFSNTSTNQGTFIVLSVSADRKTVCYYQPSGSAVAPLTGLSWTARMAAPTDTWNAAQQRGGAFCSIGSAPMLWDQPYTEGGQCNYFSWPNRLQAAQFGIGSPNDASADLNAFLPNPYYGPDAAGGWFQLPVANYGGYLESIPPNYECGYDLDQLAVLRFGTAACHSLTTVYQDPTASNAPLWKQTWSKPAWSVANGGNLSRIAVNAASTTDLASEGAAAVTVNAAAGSGTGGLVVGDGAGSYSTTIVGGYARPTPIPDSAAPGGSYYLGSDHGGALCRKDATAVTHVVAEVVSGATAGRPAAPAVGTAYFDTTLGKPVWYNGTGWVNSSGATS